MKTGVAGEVPALVGSKLGGQLPPCLPRFRALGPGYELCPPSRAKMTGLLIF